MTDAKAEYVQYDKDIFSVIVAGGRDFVDYSLLSYKLDRLLQVKATTHQIVIISGTARGADRLGERYAKERGYNLVQVPAEWNKYGKKAGYLRNVKMAEAADALVAFWNGVSNGTANMIHVAKQHKIEYRVVLY